MTGTDLTRRKFMLVSSAAIASPLLLDIADSMTGAKAAETKAAQSGKVYFIKSTCIGCQVCRMFCPANAIRFGDCQNEIDQKKCIHCGTCYRECPICVVTET